MSPNNMRSVCQCPRRAILISTPLLSPNSRVWTFGVNALGGLFSFLRKKRAVFSRSFGVVSMPSAGYSHFYVRKKNSSFNRPDYVSMPSAGYSHFYDEIYEEYINNQKGVNALGGLFSFLQKRKKHHRLRLQIVSMPSAGYSHFYLESVDDIDDVWKCQCPRRAILISTKRK